MSCPEFGFVWYAFSSVYIWLLCASVKVRSGAGVTEAAGVGVGVGVGFGVAEGVGFVFCVAAGVEVGAGFFDASGVASGGSEGEETDSDTFGGSGLFLGISKGVTDGSGLFEGSGVGVAVISGLFEGSGEASEAAGVDVGSGSWDAWSTGRVVCMAGTVPQPAARRTINTRIIEIILFIFVFILSFRSILPVQDEKAILKVGTPGTLCTVSRLPGGSSERSCCFFIQEVHLFFITPFVCPILNCILIHPYV